MTLLATIIPPDIDPTAVAKLLDEAAERHVPRSVAFLAGETPITLFGAVLLAAFDAERWPDWDHPDLPIVRAAEAALKGHLRVTGLDPWTDPHALDAWSTAHTAAEQQQALRDAAETLRTGGA